MQGDEKIIIFISYSWASEPHKKWVLDLAKKLTSDGIYTIIDEWDLKPGNDKYSFMERMVTDQKVNKVLVICDKSYQQKADERQGGVGAESQLISLEVYNKVEQEKFIPIITEKDKDSTPCMPKFLASRIYFDLSEEDTFEQEYQKLLRYLYGKPDKTRPPLGEPPVFVKEDDIKSPKTSKPIRYILDEANLVTSFFDKLFKSLDNFHFNPIDGEAYDETIIKLIDGMLPLRDDLILFLQKLVMSKLSKEDYDALHDNLERLAQFQFRPENITQYHAYYWDNYRFFCYEAILYITAILIINGKYDLIGDIINSTYFYQNDIRETSHSGISLFNQSILSIDDYRKRRLKLNRISIVADLIKSRAIDAGVNFNDLLEADLLLHHISLLNFNPKERFYGWDVWFPRLSAYAHHNQSMPLFDKMISKKYFDRVKMLFSVSSPSDFTQKIEDSKEKIFKYYQNVDIFNYSINPLTNLVSIDKIACIN